MVEFVAHPARRSKSATSKSGLLTTALTNRQVAYSGPSTSTPQARLCRPARFLIHDRRQFPDGWKRRQHNGRCVRRVRLRRKCNIRRLLGRLIAKNSLDGIALLLLHRRQRDAALIFGKRWINLQPRNLVLHRLVYAKDWQHLLRWRASLLHLLLRLSK